MTGTFPVPALWALALVAVGGTGCNWLTGSYACQDVENCPGELVCQQGFCVDAVDAGSEDGGVVDAGPGALDGGAADAGDVDAGVCVPLTNPPVGWWDANWRERRAYRFNNVSSAVDLTDFPALVTVLAETGGAPVETDELRFVDKDNTLLAHEVVAGAGGAVRAYVRLPLVPRGTASTTVWAYWDSGCPGPQPDPTDVWDEYSMVLHFNRSNLLFDSTGNTTPTVSASAFQDVAGVEGGAVKVTGGQINLPDLADEDFPQAASTVEVWFHDDDAYASAGFLFGDCSDGLCLRNALDGSQALRAEAWSNGTLVGDVEDQVNDPADWHMAAALHRAGFDLGLYIGGGSDPVSRFELPGLWAPGNQAAILGLQWGGAFDEVRISPLERDQHWLHATWLSLTDRFAVEGPPPTPALQPNNSGTRVEGAVLEYGFSDPVGGPWQSTGTRSVQLSVDGTPVPRSVNGAVHLDVATALQSSGNQGVVWEDCNGSSGVTIEIWVQPDNLLQDGPARIFSFGSDNGNQNFILGQETKDGSPGYEVRMRTSETGPAGYSFFPNWFAPASGMTTDVTHVVAVWDRAASHMYAYIDGQPQLDVDWPGVLAWQATADDVFTIGNEADRTRPWLGSVYAAALYCEKLSAEEVLANFGAAIP